MKRYFAALLAALCLLLTTGTACDAGGVGAGDSDGSIFLSTGIGGRDTVSCRLTARPAEGRRYLAVRMQLQYQKGDRFYWNPGQTQYFCRSAVDADEVGFSVEARDVIYAGVKFWSRCGEEEVVREYGVTNDSPAEMGFWRRIGRSLGRFSDRLRERIRHGFGLS